MIQEKADSESRTVEGLQKSLHDCQAKLKRALDEYEQSKADHAELIETRTKSIDLLTDDLNIKTKHIRDIEASYAEALEMLQTNQKRITELEETNQRHETNISQVLQDKSLETGELIEVTAGLKQQLVDREEDVRLYRGQVDTMNQALEGAKHKLRELGEMLKSRDVQLLENAKQVKCLCDELECLNEAKMKLTNEINNHLGTQQELDKRLRHRDDALIASQGKLDKLNNQVIT